MAKLRFIFLRRRVQERLSVWAALRPVGAWALVVQLGAAAGLAWAQPVLPTDASGSTTTGQAKAATTADGLPAPKVMKIGAIEYINGGAGEESRAAIESKQGHFVQRNVFSGKDGRYVVADQVTVRGAEGGPTADIPNAGPILLLSLPPGQYTIEATVGGKSQTKTIKVADQPVRLNWNWPGA